jgi:hypothetical protein
VARTRVVSWLRAALPAFPTDRSVAAWARVLPDTVAGPHRHHTGFRGPRPLVQLSATLRAQAGLAKWNLRGPRRAGKHRAQPLLEGAALRGVRGSAAVAVDGRALEARVQLSDRSDEHLRLRHGGRRGYGRS